MLHKEPTPTTKISSASESAERRGIGFPSLAALLRRHRLPFPPLGSCLHAKGDLLSIVPRELLLDLGPLTSWP